jgi:hypothetical protein
MKAADLIRAKAQGIAISPEALAELKKLVAHNDRTTCNHLRVNARAAVELLQSYGVKVGGRITLDKICREHLGRKTYGKK